MKRAFSTPLEEAWTTFFSSGPVVAAVPCPGLPSKSVSVRPYYTVGTY